MVKGKEHGFRMNLISYVEKLKIPPKIVIIHICSLRAKLRAKWSAHETPDQICVDFLFN